MEAALRAATDDLARERATAGVRASLAEEAERLAREELEEARADASASEARAKAAEGAGAGRFGTRGATRRSFRLREKHWVGLIECHRGAARLSRELAEMAVEGGGDASRRAVDAAAGLDVARKRAEMEAEAEAHVEAIKAVARMATPELAKSGAAVGEARDVAALSLRAETADCGGGEPSRPPHAKDGGGGVALPPREETRAPRRGGNRRAAENRRAARRRLRRARAAEATRSPRRAAEAESKALREDLDRARAALEDRDAALDAGAALVRADPETAALAMRGSSLSPSPRGRFGFLRGSRRVSLSGAEAEKEEDDGSAAPGGGTFRSVFRPKTKAPGPGSLRDPEAIALAVAAATRAIVSPSARSLEDGASLSRRAATTIGASCARSTSPSPGPRRAPPPERASIRTTRRGGGSSDAANRGVRDEARGAAAARSRLDEERARGGGGGDGTPGAESTGSSTPTPPRAEVRDSREDPGEPRTPLSGRPPPRPGAAACSRSSPPGARGGSRTWRRRSSTRRRRTRTRRPRDAVEAMQALGGVSSAGKEDENEKKRAPVVPRRAVNEAEGGAAASHPRLAALRDARSTPLGAAAARSGAPAGRTRRSLR